jgi:hypothetical protein
MILAMMTATVANIMGTRLGFTVAAIPSVVSILPKIKLAFAVFSAIFNVMKNKITGNRSNRNFIVCLKSRYQYKRKPYFAMMC